jgi:hypothetical protein
MATTESYVKSRRVRELTTVLTYADTTAAEMFKLPANARVIHWVFNVTTAFTGGTTTVDVGIETDGDSIIDGAVVSAVGNAVLGTTLVVPSYTPTAITPIYMAVGAGNTAGEVEITCMFSSPTDRRQ